jgi:hypothetical protein
METIFDHNVTEQELRRFGGRDYFEKAKQYGISPFPSEDDANYAIGLLYAIRGNQAKSKEYFNKVKSVELLKTMVQDC